MERERIYWLVILGITFFLFSPLPTLADDDAELAKKLANPVASLISVPFQYNYDEDFGVANDGSKHLMNIQPVIPISISDDLNVISRTILPVIAQDDIPSGSSRSGIGDILQSFFISPKEPTARGLIWGLGPAFLLATASDDTLGGEKWALGPTFVGLKQEGPWTYGILMNHVWSFAGVDYRKDVDSTYLQPFLSYITSTHTTFSLNSESTYDWVDNHWNAPANLLVNQLFKVGDQRIQFGVGPRYWIDSPGAGPNGWSMRAVLTLLFPQ